jgi:PAS domain-containing protein
MPFAWDFIDREFNCLDTNMAAVKLFGFKDKQEFMTRRMETFPPYQPCGTPSLEKAEKYMNIAMQDGMTSFEWLYQKPDGTPVPVELTLIRVGIRSRFVLSAFIRDLREQKALETQKKAKEELLEQEAERFKLFFNIMPAVCSFRDENRSLIMCNDSTATLFGLPDPREYLKKIDELSPLHQPCGILSTEKAAAYVEQAFETGRAEFEWMHQTYSGEPLPCTVSLIRTEFKGKPALIGFTTDMRKQNKEVL